MTDQLNLKGTVKWFSRDKGFGFLVGADGQDRHFTVAAIKGTDLPGDGDSVEYTAAQGRKGPAATNVRLVARAAKDPGPGRALCLSCGKAMVPRLITYRGEPEKSVCPFCGITHRDFTDRYCFIATAVYGDSDAPEVMTLRRFRDQVLIPNVLGQALVRSYYRLSPPIADWLRLHPTMTRVVRSGLDRIVWLYEGQQP
jgi:cold shock CspA family protein